MNRLRNRIAAAALVALLPLLSLAVACGDDEQIQPGQAPSAPSTQQDDQSAQDAAEQESQQAADQSADSTVREPQESEGQPQSESRQPRQQGEPSESAADQAKQQARQQAEARAESEPVEVALRPILGGHQFHQPVELLELPDGSLLVAEQRGYVTRFIEDGEEFEQIGILDLTESITFRGEQGLLSMAQHPDFESQPFLFVYYSPRRENSTRLSRFRIVQGVALPATELVIIEVPQPYSNHNGGAVRFGPDGMLYLGLGDGGAANDPQGHGQNRGTLLGTIIRINVTDIDTSTPYRIPIDNPFLGLAGVRPEIWAWGLRNPWRMAFDPETGLLWAADVGQDRVEEVIIVQAGENHGWNVFEGDECFRSEDDCAALSDAVAPVGTYGHDEGCSITGGMVYRGKALPHLVGAYLFGDFCSGTIWGLQADDGADTGWVRSQVIESGALIASFATDNDGEIYVLVFNGPILKLVPN